MILRTTVKMMVQTTLETPSARFKGTNIFWFLGTQVRASDLHATTQRLSLTFCLCFASHVFGRLHDCGVATTGVDRLREASASISCVKYKSTVKVAGRSLCL